MPTAAWQLVETLRRLEVDRVFCVPGESYLPALDALTAAGVTVRRRSRWYRSAPLPASDQPWFVNAVAALDTELDAISLLRLLLAVERQFGRERRQRWAARVLDLDLLCHGRAVIDDADGGLVLPHPRLHDRPFVLAPLAEIAPGWRHPVSGRTATALLAAPIFQPISGKFNRSVTACWMA